MLHGDNVGQDTHGINLSLSIFFSPLWLKEHFWRHPSRRWQTADGNQPHGTVCFFSPSIYNTSTATGTHNNKLTLTPLRLTFFRVNSGAGFSLFFPEQEEWTLWLLLRWTHRHVCQAIDCEKQFKSHTRALGAERNMNVRKWGDTREFNNCNKSLGQWSRTGLYCRSIIQNDFQNS